MKPLEQYKNMNMNIENKDKATKAISEVATNLRDHLLESLGTYNAMVQDIERLGNVTTKEEIKSTLSSLGAWSDLAWILGILIKDAYGVDTLEEAIAQEEAQEEAKQAWYKSKSQG